MLQRPAYRLPGAPAQRLGGRGHLFRCLGLPQLKEVSKFEFSQINKTESSSSVSTATDSGSGPPVLDPPAADADGDASSTWQTVVGLSTLVAMICAIDRAAISVAILPMAEEFDWTSSTKGAVGSAFFIGYTLTNFLGGLLATTWAAKPVLSIGVVVWSMFTTATPIAAPNFGTLLAARAAMGAGEVSAGTRPDPGVGQRCLNTAHRFPAGNRMA